MGTTAYEGMSVEQLEQQGRQVIRELPYFDHKQTIEQLFDLLVAGAKGEPIDTGIASTPVGLALEKTFVALKLPEANAEKIVPLFDVLVTKAAEQGMEA